MSEGNTLHDPANLEPDLEEPIVAAIHDAEVPQQQQNIQPDEVPSPREKPASCPDIYRLNKDEFNKVLQNTYAYFKDKKVKIPDGRIGSVFSVDPRPMKGSSTSAGSEGNYLCVRVPRIAAPGRSPWENVWFMPDDLVVVEQFSKDQSINT